MAFPVLSADSPALLQGATTAIVTVIVLFVLVVGVGFGLLARRRRRGGPDNKNSASDSATANRGDLPKRANVLLVRLDDAVKENNDELGFAVAQFGDAKTRAFADAIASATADLTEAFRLKQKLDDAFPDTEAQRREWNARIVQLCETSQESLRAQADAFDALRRLESNAPANLMAVRGIVAATEARIPAATATITRLNDSYSPPVLATVHDNVADAGTLLATAAAAATTADARLAEGGATDVAETVQDAEAAVRRAARLLDAIDNLDAALAAETARLAQLASDSQADLAEARAARDAPPDPESGAAIGAAITALERTLATLAESAAPADPVASIGRLQAATAELDTALATARNQTQRLEHARTALIGALVTARSQIATTEDFIAARRGGIGADARTRLAEAQRLLMIAEAEADPVTALDTARSSATYSRDADALARYDVLR